MLLIKNGCIINPMSDHHERADILIDKGIIQKIGSISEADYPIQGLETINADGLKIGPGLVDIHAHFRDPGFTYKEDIYTGAKAAAKGGFTTVILMANTKPAVDLAETLEYIQNKAKEARIKVLTCACVTKEMQGKELTDMSLLKEKGAIGFTDDGIPIMDEEILKQALDKAKELGMPISLHEEDPKYISENGINRGKASEHYGIGGSDRQAEISMIKRDVHIALQAGAELNIQHISTKEGVEIIREARGNGSNIHAEATPHHFSFTQDDAIEYGTLAKMNPPLREEEDRLAIIEGLKDGTIEFIATDHAPHSKEEKDKPITQAPSGIIGLETAFGLAVTYLVREGHLKISEIFQKMSYNPAKLYGLNAGVITEGVPADLIIFDEDEAYIYSEDEICSKSHNTPLIGKELYGKVHYTICDGDIVYKHKKCTSQEGYL